MFLLLCWTWVLRRLLILEQMSNSQVGGEFASVGESVHSDQKRTHGLLKLALAQFCGSNSWQVNSFRE